MRWWQVAGLAVVLASCAAGRASLPPRPPAAPAAPRLENREAERRAFVAAYHLVRKRDFAPARPLLEALQGRCGDLEDYCIHYLALACAARGEIDHALALWERLGASFPQSIHAGDAALERGRILLARRRSEQARAALEQARASADDDLRHAAEFEIAQLEEAAGNLFAAHARLTALRRAVAGSSLGRRARQKVEELRRRDPALAPQGEALRDELRLLVREGEHRAAADLANRLLARAAQSEQPELLRLRADAEEGAGEVSAAVVTLREIARRHPRSPEAPQALFRAARLLWNRDRDAEAEQAFRELLRRYPRAPDAGEALYAIGRIEQASGRVEDAIGTYSALARRAPRSKLGREAAWRIGWIRYEQGSWAEAARELGKLAAGPGSDAADALYWQARALERSGKRARAEALYRRVLSEAPSSYYAHWAERRLGVASPAGAAPAAPAAAFPEPPPGMPPFHLIRARELVAIGLRAAARVELRRLEREAGGDARATRFLIAAYPAADAYRDVVRLQRARNGDERLAYPLAFWSVVSQHAGNRLDPLLVLSLMRQESMFDPEARSSAGARGLMQLLPRTAEAVARERGLRVDAENLYDPETNIELGVAHFDDLLRQYGGDPIRALAAYNGGEDAVRKWERRFAGREPDEFVESITYRETRDYVKRVLANYRKYRQLYTLPATL